MPVSLELLSRSLSGYQLANAREPSHLFIHPDDFQGLVRGRNPEELGLRFGPNGPHFLGIIVVQTPSLTPGTIYFVNHEDLVPARTPLDLLRGDDLRFTPREPSDLFDAKVKRLNLEIKEKQPPTIWELLMKDDSVVEPE